MFFFKDLKQLFLFYFFYFCRKIDEDAKQHEGTTVQEMETVDSPEPIEPSEELSHQTPALFYDSPHLPMRRQGIVYIQFSVNGVVRPAIGIKLCRRSAPNVYSYKYFFKCYLMTNQ